MSTASVSASGNLSAATTVNVDFSGSGGTVTDIYVVEGDKVKKGESLAKVDDTTQRQQLRTAKAGLASAEAQLASTTGRADIGGEGTQQRVGEVRPRPASPVRRTNWPRPSGAPSWTRASRTRPSPRPR